ncbi:hypothetical protein EVAR_35517_1 [Eumeta japonica]|uniref:Endonuclease/exonuclease/phosphatase domain-containing protein n=1 Tax=Eumeta variegata TaxID=151549 RepID=A0A4C1X4T4_EUMVA|nr:hypothetical protein EVAR_35517_1 [Eumeta japonica]
MPAPKPTQKKPRRAAMRPDALIIRPKEKEKYSDILSRIKTAVPSEQVGNTVNKIRKTAAGDMLITLCKGSADKGKVLWETNAGILEEDAKVIGTSPEDDLEIRDLDDTTTIEDILAALQKAAGNDCGITAEAIKIRKAFRGTQTAVKARLTDPNSASNVEKKDTQSPSATSQLNVHYALNNSVQRMLLTMPAQIDAQSIKRHSRRYRIDENEDIPAFNISHCEAAHDLLMQTVRDLKLNLVLISEPYKHLNDKLWETDRTSKAVIWSCGKLPFQSIVNNKSAGFVAASVDGINIYSCYAPPSLSIVEFTDFLGKLTEDAKQLHPVAIAGDFNSSEVDWGSKQTNARGRALLKAFTTIDVVLLNYGDTPTYIKGDACSTFCLRM